MRDGAGRLVQRLDLWTAFRALRNHTVHSGQTADQVCREALALFRAPLDRLLGHFDFLADYELLAAAADLARAETDPERVPLRLLRGADLPEPRDCDLSGDPALCAALARSPVVLRAPNGRVQPLFPFCHGHFKRADLALWSIRDSVNDYSRRTVAELGGTKYIPAAHLDRPGWSALASRSTADISPSPVR